MQKNLLMAQNTIQKEAKTIVEVNRNILEKNILKAAQLLQKKLDSDLRRLNISYQIYNNQLLSSPHINIDSSYIPLMRETVQMHDSLQIKSRDYLYNYQIAEFKYRITNNFSESNQLYNYVYTQSNKIDYKKASLSRIFDINISKDDIEGAKQLIEFYNKRIK